MDEMHNLHPNITFLKDVYIKIHQPNKQVVTKNWMMICFIFKKFVTTMRNTKGEYGYIYIYRFFIHSCIYKKGYVDSITLILALEFLMFVGQPTK